jgi:hypothetical protein
LRVTRHHNQADLIKTKATRIRGTGGSGFSLTKNIRHVSMAVLQLLQDRRMLQRRDVLRDRLVLGQHPQQQAHVWSAVRLVACAELQDAMDLNYLTGQRPGDAWRISASK